MRLLTEELSRSGEGRGNQPTLEELVEKVCKERVWKGARGDF